MTKTKKIILISALEGLAALALAALLVFSLWILCSPQTMATASEKTGNYSFAVTCADLRYQYTKKTEDLARCVQDSILCGNDEKIVKYGESFLTKADFEEVCLSRGENFKIYVCGNIALAQYNIKTLEKAISTCETGGELSFIKLTVAVVEKGSAEQRQALKAALEKQTQTDTIINLINLLDTGE
ncbi:MAG: hypothetical protein K2H30_02930 [Clostridia bacterium]|nr:hypothetical protein [Clostridia bacterium]